MSSTVPAARASSAGRRGIVWPDEEWLPRCSRSSAYGDFAAVFVAKGIGALFGRSAWGKAAGPRPTQRRTSSDVVPASGALAMPLLITVSRSAGSFPAPATSSAAPTT